MSGGPGWARHLPWIDGFAALSGGALGLAFRGLLVDLYGVSGRFLTTVAFVNLLYSVMGLTLGALKRRPSWLLTALIAANFFWTVICILVAVRAPPGATAWAYGHLLGEGAFCAALATLEWRYRRSILELRS